MCIAIACPIGERVPSEVLDNAAVNNPDGAGYAYVDDFGKVQMNKAATYAEIRDQLDADLNEYGERSPFVIHFRIATHGAICSENAHPFKLAHGGVMIHNGILHIKGLPTNTSDSKYFANNVISKLPANWYRTPHWPDYLTSMIGTGNKIVCLYPDGELTILGEKRGDWKDGCWYSNSSGHTVYVPTTQVQATSCEYDVDDVRDYGDWSKSVTYERALAAKRQRAWEDVDPKTGEITSWVMPIVDRDEWTYHTGRRLWVKRTEDYYRLPILEGDVYDESTSEWEEYVHMLDAKDKRALLAEALSTDCDHMEDDDVEDFLVGLPIEDMPLNPTTYDAVQLVRDALVFETVE